MAYYGVMITPAGKVPRPGVAVRLLPEAHGIVQQLALRVSADIGRRVSMSELIGAAVLVAQDHPEALAAHLRVTR